MPIRLRVPVARQVLRVPHERVHVVRLQLPEHQPHGQRLPLERRDLEAHLVEVDGVGVLAQGRKLDVAPPLLDGTLQRLVQVVDRRAVVVPFEVLLLLPERVPQQHAPDDVQFHPILPRLGHRDAPRAQIRGDPVLPRLLRGFDAVHVGRFFHVLVEFVVAPAEGHGRPRVRRPCLELPVAPQPRRGFRLPGQDLSCGCLGLRAADGHIQSFRQMHLLIKTSTE